MTITVPMHCVYENVQYIHAFCHSVNTHFSRVEFAGLQATGMR